MYISRLIAKGYKVAICEQVEDPKEAKGIVKRDVVRVVTPGTVIESNMLDEKKNNYIMSIYKTGVYFGLAVCDITTGDFLATQITESNNYAKLLDEFARFLPAEAVVNDYLYNSSQEITDIKQRFNIILTSEKEEEFGEDYSDLQKKYTIVDDNEEEIKEFEDSLLALAAANGLLSYLHKTQKIKLEHINIIKIYKIQKYMVLDITARRNLELTERMSDKSKKGSLLWVLDRTSTSMGGRQLRRWLNNPLIDVFEINKRLEAIKELKENLMLKGETIVNLKKIYDIERLVRKDFIW